MPEKCDVFKTLPLAQSGGIKTACNAIDYSQLLLLFTACQAPTNRVLVDAFGPETTLFTIFRRE
jgi:hypothetical protein